MTATDFDPQGTPPEENPDEAQLAVDGNPTTAWRRRATTRTSARAGSRPGVGLVLDLGADHDVSQVDLTTVGSPTHGPGLRHCDRPRRTSRAPQPAGQTTVTGTHGVVQLDPAADRSLRRGVADPAARPCPAGSAARSPRSWSRVTDGPDDDRTDADLLAAHVAGDPDAFATLFTRHRDRLWAVALRTMGNPHDAADGLQDGLVAAYRRAGQLPRRRRRHHLAAPGRGQRLPGPAPGREGTPGRGAARRPRRHRDRGSAYTSTSPVDDPEQAAIAGRPPPRGPGRPRARSRPSSGPRWCWSTWRATRSPRSR